VSKRLEDLYPPLATLALQILAKSETVGIPIRITNTLRTHEEQASLYAQGRTAPGPIVTQAKPGYSYHNYGLAFDFVILAGTVPTYSDRVDWNKNEYWDYKEVGEIGKSLGLNWGGDWGWDAAHFEMRVLPLRELRAGKEPPKT